MTSANGLQRPTSGAGRICAALDVPDPAAAAKLAGRLAGKVGLFKVGLELFVAHGRAAIDGIATFGIPIFLDLKLHDIPQTVESASRGAGAMGAALVTVHASGGAEMVRAAKRGLEAGARSANLPAPKLLAVTVLTSIGDAELATIGMHGPARVAARHLALLAHHAGADGLVCSPEEVQVIRAELGPAPFLVVPGVRPAGSDKGDQKRTGTPREAVQNGADWLVIGRPLRDAKDPGAAAEAIAEEIDAA